MRRSLNGFATPEADPCFFRRRLQNRQTTLALKIIRADKCAQAQDQEGYGWPPAGLEKPKSLQYATVLTLTPESITRTAPPYTLFERASASL
jgi:hypothetical protein